MTNLNTDVVAKPLTAGAGQNASVDSDDKKPGRTLPPARVPQVKAVDSTVHAPEPEEEPQRNQDLRNGLKTVAVLVAAAGFGGLVTLGSKLPEGTVQAVALMGFCVAMLGWLAASSGRSLIGVEPVGNAINKGVDKAVDLGEKAADTVRAKVAEVRAVEKVKPAEEENAAAASNTRKVDYGLVALIALPAALGILSLFL